MTMNATIPTVRRYRNDYCKATAQTDAKVYIKLTWKMDFHDLQLYDQVVVS